MALEFTNQVFYVSAVKKSRKEADRKYYSVNIVFKSQEDIESHAVAHVKWLAQNEIRNTQDIEAGIKERPKNFKPYVLPTVPRFEGEKMPDGWAPEAKASINSDGSIRPDLRQQLAEMEMLMENLKANNPDLYEAMAAKFRK